MIKVENLETTDNYIVRQVHCAWLPNGLIWWYSILCMQQITWNDVSLNRWVAKYKRILGAIVSWFANAQESCVRLESMTMHVPCVPQLKDPERQPALCTSGTMWLTGQTSEGHPASMDRAPAAQEVLPKVRMLHSLEGKWTMPRLFQLFSLSLDTAFPAHSTVILQNYTQELGPSKAP